MNKLSGYNQFKLANGETLEVKFSNGAYEIFGQLLGVETIEEIDAALKPKTKIEQQDGKDVEMPVMTLTYMRNFRLFFLAAAKYAALVQGKRDIAGVALDEVNEYMAAEWLEEIGYDAVLNIVPKPEAEEPKKKPMAQRVKATQ